MSHLIVITFDNPEEAGKVRKTLRSVQTGGHLRLDDSAVVTKDADGKFHVKNEVDRGVKIGALGGGFLGVLIGSVFFPFAGLLIGLLGGAAIGAAAKMGISQSFVKEVAADMENESSALFIIVRDSDPDVAVSALKPYKGKLYQTTLSPEAEENLRGVLKKEIK
jgi:uncharacterized membrane protein